MKDIRKLEDLTPDPRNSNIGTKRGEDLLDTSFRRYGPGRSGLADRNGVMIAGNHALEKAVELGLSVRVVRTRGNEWVVVQREDLDMGDPSDTRARELAIADNQTTLVGVKYDGAVLAEDVARGVDVGAFFFQDELARLTQSAADFVENAGAMGVPPELSGALQDEIDAATAPNITAGETDDQAPSGGLGTPVISYTLVFDSDTQQQRWFAFLRYLKGRYVAQPTIGARLDQYLREQEAAIPALATTE